MRLRIYLIISMMLYALAGARAADNIRYVKTESAGGAYANNGLTWETAKDNIQDAINDLVDQGLTGEVWVAAGEYTPKASTETEGGSMLYMSFQIYPGISVIGGFAGNEDSKDERTTSTTATGEWQYTYETILKGDLGSDASFTWNSTKKQYTTSFHSSCYHVVWFATNGFDDEGRANALDTSNGEAVLEGCTVRGGNAKNTDLTGRSHTAYGGGIYMTEGSRVENCRIYNCEASRDGGGVYMDGGGVLEHCYVFDCQALGLSLSYGYGGGVCLEANTSSTAMGVERSYIAGCVGRMGGGLAIKVPTLTGDDGTNMRYKAYASAVAVVNNTATTEGGGVYTYQGGVMTQMTIARNQCNGSGVTINDMKTGRSAGLYCRDFATVLNSVLWGGECDANNNVQFATSRSSSDYKAVLQYCSLSESSYVDWSGSTKTEVSSLASYNNSAAATDASVTVPSTSGYPQFEVPTDTAGHMYSLQTYAYNTYNWKPTSNSSLCNAGIDAIDLDRDGVFPFTEISEDIYGVQYTPHATQGAYTRETATVTPYTSDDGNTISFFVDPNGSSEQISDVHGNSWDQPTRFLSTVLETIRGNLKSDENYYDGKIINIYVKEGTLYNTNPYYHGRVRTMTIDIPSNVNLYGGYYSGLTGTSLETRNPRIYPTIISGEVTSDFDMNAAHLVTFDGVTDVVFDGFQIRFANATSDILGNDSEDKGNEVIAAQNGAAMRFLNGAKVTVKNTLVADCQADDGAAVYTTGGCTVSFENCIFHNNTSTATSASTTTGLSGIIYSEGADKLTFDHCDIMRNVGYAAWIGSSATHEYTNCIFYANMSEAMDETSGSSDGAAEQKLGYALTSFVGSTEKDNLSGSHCFFDKQSESFNTIFGTIGNEYQYALSYRLNGDGYPRFSNPTSNAGVSTGGDVTRYGRTTSFQPHNTNPIVNAASYDTSLSHDEWGTDMSTVTTRDYGGLPDVGAIENHAATVDDEGENAYTDGQRPYGSVIYVRDYNTYGTDGVTCTDTDEDTTHEDGTARDGSSWENAINGNGLYTTTGIVDITTYSSVAWVNTGSINSRTDSTYQVKLGTTYNNTVYYLYAESSGSSYTLSVTDDPDKADTFVFIYNSNSSAYFLYDVTVDYYIHYTTTGSFSYKSGTNNSNVNKWSYSSSGSDNTYTLRTTTGTTRYLYYNGTLQLSTSSSSYWSSYQATTGKGEGDVKIRGLQYAIDQANELFVADTDEDKEARSVYVGGGIYGGTTGTSYADATDVTDGKYSLNLTMKEGVNVYGGFPRTGNPGEDERNISNQDTDDDGNVNTCRTFLDANSSGRVITQDGDFTTSSMFEGFIIQNGSVSSNTDLGGGVQLAENGIIKNCLIQNNTIGAADGATSSNRVGGGGIYIGSGGLVKNCVIKNNYVFANGKTTYIGGAGVFSAGGTLQNSLIVENTAQSSSYFILGAGVYISSASNLYNCTIAYNVGRQTATSGTSNKKAATGGVWDNGAERIIEDGVVTGYEEGTYSLFYNCILWGNYGTGSTLENYHQVGMGGFTYGGGFTSGALKDCYTSIAYEGITIDGTDEDKVFDVDLLNAITTDEYASSAETESTSGGENYELFLQICKENQPFTGTYDTTDYSLSGTGTSVYCINMGGSEDVLEEQNITEDIAGEERIQDCTVDKGAYEYNNSYAISPDTDNKDNTGYVAFYVTPDGEGTASGANPANAACASKLQKVLDAAGRYKYLNPSTKVVVKVANSATLAASNDSHFTYYATRTTDVNSDNPRVWSILVPRGVEVWGGYSDGYDSATDNGFYTLATDEESNTTTYTDNRDILGHPTYFDSSYLSTAENSTVSTYHVITFTDKIYDANGMPYLKDDDLLDENGDWNDSKYDGSVGDVLLTMSDTYTYTTTTTDDDSGTSTAVEVSYGGVTDRAIVDGIFITGGDADVNVSGTSAIKDINQYGGAAIVTDYAHVRNCIVRGNYGNYGGALALTHGALVSGCLIDQNTAEYGGAIYVFAHGDVLSDGTKVSTEKGNDDTTLDANMPHVYTSTIVNNLANTQGGGVWFGDDDANVRFNSTVVWQNECSDQPNISGLYSITKPEDDTNTIIEFYPFNYCAVQNLTIMGLNNLEVGSLNRQGVRFHKYGDGNKNTLAQVNESETDFTKLSDFGYFELTNYSELTCGGMPLVSYKSLIDSVGLAEYDFAYKSRTTLSKSSRKYVDIGARAYDKQYPTGLMLRIYVAKPADTDMDAALVMMNSNDTYYSMEGSSTAYPMMHLQDALDYINTMREIKTTDDDGNTTDPYVSNNANNLPFEICLAGGTYSPMHDLSGKYTSSVAYTYLIPEGVSIIGGFDVGSTYDSKGTKVTNAFYGAGYEANSDAASDADDTDISDNKTAIGTETVTIEGTVTDAYGTTSDVTYTIYQQETETMKLYREHTDVNANSIIEPWEYTHQTILDGAIGGTGGQSTDHVITLIANETVAGALPIATPSSSYAGSDAEGYGYTPYETGQTVTLDGITITGGSAYGYQTGTVDEHHKLKYNQGGGIMVDGNRYCNTYNHEDETGFYYKHHGVPYSVGYRDIPLVINKCKFEGNTAGLGGAISSNGTVSIFSSSFENNLAKSNTTVDKVDYEGTDYEVTYPGVGGAIYSTYHLSAANTLFANNEALDENYYCGRQAFHLLNMQVPETDVNTDSSSSSEGTVTTSEDDSSSGSEDDSSSSSSGESDGSSTTTTTSESSIAIAGSGGAVYMGTVGTFHFINCDFVRNEANAYPAIYTRNPNTDTQVEDNVSVTSYNKILNSVLWGNELNETMVSMCNNGEFSTVIGSEDTAKEGYLFATNLILNYGKRDREGDFYASVKDGTQKYNIEGEETEGTAPYTQAALDESYSEMAWFCAYEEGRGITANNTVDLRETAFDFNSHIVNQIITATSADDKTSAQNCNIALASSNSDPDGPNFISPSTEAGNAGYLESADWSPSRLNSLTDNGSGWIINTKQAGSAYTNGKDAAGLYTSMIFDDNEPQFEENMPLGTDVYMRLADSSSSSEDSEDASNYYRISFAPNSSDNVYIDIGVYEYMHTELQVSHDGEVDILWVSDTEKPENGEADGRSWSQPTSDMQLAIETLLKSRNDHRKEIRVIEGTISPTYLMDDMTTFLIDTKRLNQSATGVENQETGVMSLTIKGGYSKENEDVYDVDEYPSIIRQQTRTNDSSPRWDHLIYIEDPVQRYAQGVNASSSYTDGNDGRYAASNSESKIVNTISIEIDGVTLINDQALAGVQGSVIYYRDLTDEYGTELEGPVSTYASVPVSGSSDEEQVVTLSGQAKLIVSKSTIVGSGNSADVSTEYTDDTKYPSAIYIGEAGGHALLYNNVMHSNYVSPIIANCKAYTMNNTYAFNYGPAYYNVDASTIHNSVFWKNCPTTSDGTTTYGKQFSLKYDDETLISPILDADANASDIEKVFSHNSMSNDSYVTSNGSSVSYVQVTDYTNSTGVIAGNNYNTALSDDNEDVLRGPYFTDPKADETLSTADEMLERDFSLLPSLRLLNQGDNNKYAVVTYDSSSDAFVTTPTTTTDSETGETTTTNTYSISLDTSESDSDADETRKAAVSAAYGTNGAYAIYDLSASPSVNYDAASNTRVVDDSIDIGAYEYEGELRRVMYMDPSSETMGDDAGSSWATPYPYGSLQSAINLAAIYHVNHSEKQAYVFVKGVSKNSTRQTGETITMRNGVSVYGGISPLYNTDCEYEDESLTDEDAIESTISSYVSQIKSDIEAYVGPASYKTYINGINVSSYSVFDSKTLVDGFHITNSEEITEPVINVRPTSTNAPVALSHIVVSGNTADPDEETNIAYVNNALIYEALFHDNTLSGDGAVLELGDNGYAVNITAEGTTIGTDKSSTLNGVDNSGSSTGSHVINSLVNYANDAATLNTLSGTHYQLDDTDLNFQLEEGSKHIDACDQTANLYNPTEILPENLRSFVNYSSDRDLLGNPRLLSDVSSEDYVDRGAFETWKVEESKVVKTSTDGHFYPHEGSMVYLMKGSSMVCGTDITPGFLLVQEGASLFGSGNNVNVAYAAVERTVQDDGSIVSLPYAMNYADNAKIPSYDSDGVLTLDGSTNDYYTYNGKGRSSWDYVFQTSNSGMWEPASDDADANEGVLFIPGKTDTTDGATETYYRFTAQGSSMTDYIYTESVDEQYKTVELTQNDDRTSTSGGADFTSSEDMGWNCTGLPYLVSKYKTYGHNYVSDDDDANDVLYNMQSPHTMWLYYDGKTDPIEGAVEGDGGYYSVSSWDDTDWHLSTGETPYIWTGEGIFMQTAAVSESEALRFYRPVYEAETSSEAEYAVLRLNTRYYAAAVSEMSEDVTSGIGISVKGHIIRVTGLQGGEHITIYDSTGRIYNIAEATSETYTTALPARGVYIVKVNNAAKKVLIR